MYLRTYVRKFKELVFAMHINMLVMCMHVYIYTYVYVLTYVCIYCVCLLLYAVPIPNVQITTTENETSVDYYASGQSDDDISRYSTFGDPLTLDCIVTAIRGISSSVSIIWTTGERVVRRVDNITADVENDTAIYTDSFEISSLSAIDNGREYQCTVMINATQPVNSSDQFILTFPGEYRYLCTYVYT